MFSGAYSFIKNGLFEYPKKKYTPKMSLVASKMLYKYLKTDFIL